MAISTQTNPTYISAADAVANAKNAKTAATAGNATTSRGTLITKSNTEFDKNSFLKILSAQLSNLDPTQNQDSSAYVAQMAQFASMEQMANLNTTMSDSAYQQMLGKKVILNEKDDAGAYVEGYVTKVEKKSGVNYLTMNINGKDEEVDVKNVIGAVQTTDTNTTANSRAALNSDFLAASALAADKKNVVIAEVGTDGKTTLVKGTVSGAYIDTVSSAEVKIKVNVSGTDGNVTTKTYNYGDIVRAGDLTTDEMNVTLPTTGTTSVTTDTSGTTSSTTGA
jgi:flagellar basal-body rod modification protein FlgD